MRISIAQLTRPEAPFEKYQRGAAIPVWGAMRVTPADAFRKTI
jgi:hypothetical protein